MKDKVNTHYRNDDDLIQLAITAYYEQHGDDAEMPDRHLSAVHRTDDGSCTMVILNSTTRPLCACTVDYVEAGSHRGPNIIIECSALRQLKGVGPSDVCDLPPPPLRQPPHDEAALIGQAIELYLTQRDRTVFKPDRQSCRVYWTDDGSRALIYLYDTRGWLYPHYEWDGRTVREVQSGSERARELLRQISVLWSTRPAGME